MPQIYPCFYSSINGQLLVCASQSNPTQRCPIGYTRVGETLYCQPNTPASSSPAKPITMKSTTTLPRTGGDNFKLSLGVMLIVLAILVTVAVVNLIRKQD